MDLNQIEFTPGSPFHFKANKSFNLGVANGQPLQITKGSDCMFDGQTLSLGGVTYNMPTFRGAIKADWVAFAEDYDPELVQRPVSANVQVRHATQGGNPMSPPSKSSITTTESDERQVMSVGAHARATQANNRAVSAGNGVARAAGSSVVEPQDGVPVRSLKTSAKAKTILTAESTGTALREAAQSGVIDPGQGVTQEEMLERMTPEARKKYLDSLAKVGSKPGVVEAAQPRVVRTMSKTSESATREGITAHVTVGGGTETFDAGSISDEKPDEKVVTMDGITFRQTNGAKADGGTPVVKKGAAAKAAPAPAATKSPGLSPETRLKVAKAICSDFPDNYDFGAPAKKRLARITADFEDRPDVIRAIFAAEDDDMKAALVAEFPSVFA